MMEDSHDFPGINKMERYVNYDRHNKVWKVKVPRAGNTKLKVHKNFSVKKYGAAESYKMAVEHRDTILNSQRNLQPVDSAPPTNVRNENTRENVDSEGSLKRCESEDEKLKGESSRDPVDSKSKNGSDVKEDSHSNNHYPDTGQVTDITTRRNPSRSWRSNSAGSISSVSPISTTPSISHSKNPRFVQPLTLDPESQNYHSIWNNSKRKRGRPSKGDLPSDKYRLDNFQSKSYFKDHEGNISNSRIYEGSSWLSGNELDKTSQKSYLCDSEQNLLSDHNFSDIAENGQYNEEINSQRSSMEFDDSLMNSSKVVPRRSKRKKIENIADPQRIYEDYIVPSHFPFQNEENFYSNNLNQGGSYLPRYESHDNFEASNNDIRSNYSPSTEFNDLTSNLKDSLIPPQTHNSDAALLMEAFFFVFSDLLFVCVPKLDCSDRSRRRYDATVKSILRLILDAMHKPGKSIESFVENCNWIELISPYITEISLPSQTLPMTQCLILNSLCGLDKN